MALAGVTLAAADPKDHAVQAAPALPALLGRRLEATGFVVGFTAGQRGVEDADQPQIGLHPHDVALMGVQRVSRPRHDGVALTGGQVLHPAQLDELSLHITKKGQATRRRVID
jgi:hypothetical protein